MRCDLRATRAFARGGFTLVETLIAIGVVTSVGVLCALLATSGTTAMSSAWNRSDDIRAASTLLDRLSIDVRAASAASLENAETLRLDVTVLLPGGGTRDDGVRYTVTSSGGGIAVTREVRLGSDPWKMDPMRPIATFTKRPDADSPTLGFTVSPATGRVTVELETDRVSIDETIYPRFG